MKGARKKGEEGQTRSTMPMAVGRPETGPQARKPFGRMFRKGPQQAKGKERGAEEARSGQQGEPGGG